MSTSAGRVLLIPKGEYNASTTYQMLDLVSYEGSSYVCKQTSTGNLPTNTTYWQLSAESVGYDLTETTATGNPVSFTTDSSGISKDTIVTLEPIQSGSGDPSPTNVRPISGYNEIEVNGCGVNVWDEEWESGTIDSTTGQNAPNANRIRSKNYIPVISGEQYYLVGSFAFIPCYDANKNYIGYANLVNNMVTIPNNCQYIRFAAMYATYNYNISINYPSTDTSYHAYTGHRITSPLPSTIYGGTYDVETGESTVDRALVDLGTLNWSYSSDNAYFYTNSVTNGKDGRPLICSQYNYVGTKNHSDMATVQTGSIANNVIGETIKIKDTNYSDAASFKTAMSGVQLVYELATPYTIQLEPHLLNLFEGQNNISTNGTQISVTYRNGIVARVDDFNAVGESFEALADKVKDVETDITTTSDTTPYIFRQTTENAVYEKLIGASVVKNQLVPKTKATGTSAGVTFTNNNDGSWTLTGTPNTNTAFLNLNYEANTKRWVNGHKYYVNTKNNYSEDKIGIDILSDVSGSSIQIDNAEKIVAWTVTGDQTSWCRLHVYNLSGTDIDTVKITPQVIDLTLMFGTSIADKVYTMEQATAGSGIAWLKSYGFLSETYIPYNTGTITSVVAEKRVARGFNQWDEEWEKGGYSYGSTGAKNTSPGYIRSANLISVLPNTEYYFKRPSGDAIRVGFYDKNGTYLGNMINVSGTGATFTTPQNCGGITFDFYATTYNHDICINISDAEKNGTYEPYNGVSYNLGSDTLRGLYTLDGDNLVANGDVKTNDGQITRKYGIVDLGSLTWSYSDAQGFGSSAIYALVKKPIDNYKIINGVCSKYKLSYYIAIANNTEDKILAISTTGVMFIRDSAYTDPATFKTAMSGVYLVYELATPTTEIFTPFASPQVALDTEEMISPIPVGHEASYVTLPNWMQKKIFDDVIADATRVEDIAEDVSGKAESSALAPVENGATASKAYAVGEHFYRDGAFCTAKASIAQGAQFTLGTNYTARTVADSMTYKVISTHPTADENATITITEPWTEAVLLIKYDTDTTVTMQIINGMPAGCTYRFSVNQEDTLAYGYVWYYSNNMKFGLDGFVRKVGGTATDLKRNPDVLFAIYYR